MHGSYPIRYADKHGVVDSVIYIDGQELRLTIRDVEFWGYDFDGLEPVKGTHPDKLESFVLNRGDLCSCTIECEFPVEILADNHTLEAGLHIHIKLGNPAPKGWLDQEVVELTLHYNDIIIRSSGQSGWFEGELLDIQKAMPTNHFLKICFGCAYSDYSPYGHGLFGYLYCFRGNKEAYLAVKSKDDIFAIWDTATEEVQETHLCPDFQVRKPGTGYRG